MQRCGTTDDLLSAKTLAVSMVIVWLCFFLVQLAGPHDLTGRDQERSASYVMDAIRNGNWICQRDFNNEVTSKPPLYTWLTALTTLPFQRISRFTISFPSALSVLLTASLVFAIGTKVFGKAAGFYAALMCIVSPAGFKQLCLARTDPLFTLMVFVTAVLIYGAWRNGRGWSLAWLAAAGATLTKGPLGLVLASGGLFAYFWERRSGNRIPLKGSHMAGLIIFMALTLGWFVMAYLQCGQDLIDKMIKSELVGHAVTQYKGTMLGSGFYKPSFCFLTRFLPWSIFAGIGFWNILKTPAQATSVRCFERFIFCFFFSGLLVLSMSPIREGITFFRFFLLRP